MRSFSDELYHYGVKGMKWGVRKEDYEPKGDSGTSSNKNTKSQSSNGSTKRTSASYQSRNASEIGRRVKNLGSKGSMRESMRVSERGYGYGSVSGWYDKNGIPNSKYDQTVALSLASEDVDAMGELDPETKKALEKKLYEEYLKKIKDARAWTNGGKELYEAVDKGKKTVEKMFSKMKDFSQKTLASSKGAIEKGMKSVSDFLSNSLNIQSTGWKKTTGKPLSSLPKSKQKSSTQQKLEKLLNIKDRERRVY